MEEMAMGDTGDREGVSGRSRQGHTTTARCELFGNEVTN